MQELKLLLEQNLNDAFLSIVISNPKNKEGIQKIKVRPILKKEQLLFQCEAYKNNQVFHDNYEKSEAVVVLCKYMERFGQMQLTTKQFLYTVSI